MTAGMVGMTIQVAYSLKRLSRHFCVCLFWPVLIGQDRSRYLFWFLNFYVAPSNLYSDYLFMNCFIPKQVGNLQYDLKIWAGKV